MKAGSRGAILGVLVVFLLLLSACDLVLAGEEGTPTPTVYGTPTPLVGTPTTMATPTPLVGTPTPTATPTPKPLATRQPVNAFGTWVEVADTPGWPSSTDLAIHPGGGRIAVAWIAWGWFWGKDEGTVWARAMTEEGRWGTAQSVNIQPLYKAMGGVQVAISPAGTITVAWSDQEAIWLVTSDDGENWSAPVAIGASVTGPLPEPTYTPTPVSAPATTPTAYPTATPTPTPAPPGATMPGTLWVIALEYDARGGLHLLFLGNDGDYFPNYAYRAPGQDGWFVRERIQGGGSMIKSDLDVVVLPDGRVRRVISAEASEASSGDTLWIFISDDGEEWRAVQAPLSRWYSERVSYNHVLAAPRGEEGLIVVAWQQYCGTGVYATVSTDRGQTWSSEERIAQYYEDGSLYNEDGSWRAVGWEPSLAYDPATDRITAVWHEWPIPPDSPGKGLRQSFLSSRAAGEAPEGGNWSDSVTPELLRLNRPAQVGSLGYKATIYNLDGSGEAWLLAADETNQQYRLYVRQVMLSAFLVSGEVR